MIELINIKEFYKEGREQIKKRVSELPPISLGIIWIGDSAASEKYVNNKIKDCEYVGIKTQLFHKEDMIDDEFISLILSVNNLYDYIIVQKPLPEHLEKVFNECKHRINPCKDIDAANSDMFFYACTPYGICQYLDANQIDVDGKDITIIGRSDLVGKPLAKMLTDKNATVTLCHSHTKDIYKHTRDADIVVCAVGHRKFLNCEKVNPFAIIIDVGINFDENGKMCGDCYNSVWTQQVTPVPGGVGLLTRLALIDQMSGFAKKINEVID